MYRVVFLMPPFLYTLLSKYLCKRAGIKGMYHNGMVFPGIPSLDDAVAR